MRLRSTPSSSAQISDIADSDALAVFVNADFEQDRAVGLRVDDGRAKIHAFRSEAHAAIAHRQANAVEFVCIADLPCEHCASFFS